MKKVELLNILYAERERLVKQYSQPGWTKWAIYAAMASLCWMAWDLADQSKDWSYAALVFGLIYASATFVSSCFSSFRKFLNVPLWRKGYIKNYVTAIIHTTICAILIVTQWLLIPHTYHPTLYKVALGCEALNMMMCVFALIQNIKGYAHSYKYVKLVWLFCLPFIPIIVLYAMYLNGLEYNSIAARCGVLAYVILCLLSFIPVGEKKQLDQIDGLITKVLYDSEEVNEKSVLRELELYVVGLRYGRYLSETQLKSYVKLISQLFNCSKRLMAEIEGGEGQQAEALIAEGDEICTKLSKTSLSMLTKIQATYREDNMDNSLTPVLQVGNIGVAIMRYWIRLGEIQKADMPNKKEEIDKVYNETVGSEKIQRMIDDDRMWEAMVK